MKSVRANPVKSCGEDVGREVSSVLNEPHQQRRRRSPAHA